MKKNLAITFVIIAVSSGLLLCDQVDDMLNNTAPAQQTATQQAGALIGGLSAGALLWGLIFSSIGVGFFLYGRKKSNLKLMLVSGLLVAYPYVIQKTVAIVIVGIVLTAAAYLVRK